MRHLPVPYLSRQSCTLVRIPHTAALHRPFQHLQVSDQSGRLTRLLVPWTVIFPRPLQYVQVPTLSG